MSAKWLNDLIGLLKYLEKTRSDSSKIHEFRRGLESCNAKKVEKILPQLFEIYNECKEHIKENDENDSDSDFDLWILGQKFVLKLGMRSVTIMPGQNFEEYTQYFKWTLSYFDSNLDEGNLNYPNRPSGLGAMAGNLPISGKQLKMAMKKVGNMNNQQLSGMMGRVPQQGLETLASSQGAEGLVAKLKEDKKAQAIAEKIKAMKKND